jgi:hypothetical protein
MLSSMGKRRLHTTVVAKLGFPLKPPVFKHKKSKFVDTRKMGSKTASKPKPRVGSNPGVTTGKNGSLLNMQKNGKNMAPVSKLVVASDLQRRQLNCSQW